MFALVTEPNLFSTSLSILSNSSKNIICKVSSLPTIFNSFEVDTSIFYTVQSEPVFVGVILRKLKIAKAVLELVSPNTTKCCTTKTLT